MTRDQFKRPLRDLRISVTDRCNFRCGYCMPGDRTYRFLPRAELLTFEEIARLTRIFVHHGVRKLRLTGGEPLLRRDLHELVAQLAAIDGVEDLALTTNGSHLARRARALKEAGLHRVTVSLDSLQTDRFQKLVGKTADPGSVVAAIDAALAVGLKVKVNTVVQKGVNDDELVDLAGFFRERGLEIRFIEFMDVGTLNGWKLDRVTTAEEIRDRIHQVFPNDPVPPRVAGETARRYRYRDGSGSFGVIASVTQPFCGGCNRARLSARGSLFTCLFATRGIDFRDMLRSGASDDELCERLDAIWRGRDDRYSELRAAGGPVPDRGSQAPSDDDAASDKVEMYYIGG